MVLVLALMAASEAAAQPDDVADRAYRLFYGVGVLQNCQSLTEEAAASFSKAVQTLRLSEAQMIAARTSGLNRADWQWGNRGLGGYRRWCASEGALLVDWAERLRADPAAAAPVLDDGLRPPG
jgi:hypothetical protein